MTSPKPISNHRQYKKRQRRRHEKIDPLSERSRFNHTNIIFMPAKQMIELEMLIGNEWRRWRLNAAKARAYIKDRNHRGYLITPITTKENA
ncbi:hypothetical protein [Vibrio maritimus]|uniref:hypothetical protein n=1 Tax=Vibrio maritimus TaxID=990268 RepID=UPI001F447CA2|nr:hypothetical protein [Vibrio maritimus]